MNDDQVWTRQRARGALDVVVGAALEAVDPAEAVRRHLRREGDSLTVGDKTYDLSRLGRLVIVGAGKAGAPMARAVEGILGDRIDQVATGPDRASRAGSSRPGRSRHCWIQNHPFPPAAR